MIVPAILDPNETIVTYSNGRINIIFVSQMPAFALLASASIDFITFTRKYRELKCSIADDCYIILTSDGLKSVSIPLGMAKAYSVWFS
jgi:hypothetical protein